VIGAQSPTFGLVVAERLAGPRRMVPRHR